MNSLLFCSTGTWRQEQSSSSRRNKDTPRYTLISRRVARARTHATQTQTRNTTSRLAVSQRTHPPQPPTFAPESSGNVRILPRSFSVRILIKNDQEIPPERSGSSLLPSPLTFLLKTIRKLLPRAPDPPSFLFFMVTPYQLENGHCLTATV